MKKPMTILGAQRKLARAEKYIIDIVWRAHSMGAGKRLDHWPCPKDNHPGGSFGCPECYYTDENCQVCRALYDALVILNDLWLEVDSQSPVEALQETPA